MEHTYWLKQTNTPLFPEIEWNKPERRDQAGRLLIIGGHQHSLGAPANAHEYAKKEGVGDIQMALPNKVKHLVGSTLPGALFLPSTTSGELARDGLDELMAQANWADTVLLPGDLGRNSQTTMLITDFIAHSSSRLVIAKDAVDALKYTPLLLLDRAETTLIASFAQLQKLVQNMQLPTAITFDMGLVKLVAFLHEFSSQYPCSIMTLHQGNYIVATNGQVSTTATDTSDESAGASRPPV